MKKTQSNTSRHEKNDFEKFRTSPKKSQKRQLDLCKVTITTLEKKKTNLPMKDFESENYKSLKSGYQNFIVCNAKRLVILTNLYINPENNKFNSANYSSLSYDLILINMYYTWHIQVT